MKFLSAAAFVSWAGLCPGNNESAGKRKSGCSQVRKHHFKTLSLQVKLLTVLDDREFYPVGGSKKVKVNVRVIAATHRSLREQVREG